MKIEGLCNILNVAKMLLDYIMWVVKPTSHLTGANLVCVGHRIY